MALTVYSPEYFMRAAYQEALQAYEKKEIPVGAVVVAENRIIGKGYNQTERLKDPTAHAEMLAITAACNQLGSKYLKDCTLYVTLEPCVMCAGALYWTQISALCYAAKDEERGFTGKKPNLLHPKTTVERGLMEQECAALITAFFREMRNK